MRASVVVSVLALSAFAQGPKVPANVKYLTASPAVNAKAKATLTKLFTGTPPALATGESQGVLMLGPFLGQRLSKLDMRGFLSITAVIPFGQTTASLKSYGARTPDEARALMGLLRDLAPVAPVKLRAMTPQEMKLIWPFVAWDLTEPLFIVAAGERKWVVSLDAAGDIALTLGEQRKDFVYVGDVAAAFLAVLDNLGKLPAGAVDLECGTGQAVSIRAFVETIHRLTGSRAALRFGALPYRDGEIMLSQADPTALRALGWEARVSLANGLRATLREDFGRG